MTDSKDTPPLVLLVCIDALRYDCVNWQPETTYFQKFGMPRRLRTPTLDRIGAESVRFHRAVSHAGYTPLSLATTLTGSYGKTHGVVDFQNTCCRDEAAPLEEEEFIRYAVERALGEIAYPPTCDTIRQHISKGISRSDLTAGLTANVARFRRFNLKDDPFEEHGEVMDPEHPDWKDFLRQIVRIVDMKGVPNLIDERHRLSHEDERKLLAHLGELGYVEAWGSGCRTWRPAAGALGSDFRIANDAGQGSARIAAAALRSRSFSY